MFTRATTSSYSKDHILSSHIPKSSIAMLSVLSNISSDHVTSSQQIFPSARVIESTNVSGYTALYKLSSVSLYGYGSHIMVLVNLFVTTSYKLGKELFELSCRVNVVYFCHRISSGIQRTGSPS